MNLNYFKLPALTVIVIASVSCATKQYPQSTKLTDAEAISYDCSDVLKEMARTESVVAQINETGRFDYRTLLGIPGDLGIGNGIAKRTATQAAATRLYALSNLKEVKCAKKDDSNQHMLILNHAS